MSSSISSSDSFPCQRSPSFPRNAQPSSGWDSIHSRQTYFRLGFQTSSSRFAKGHPSGDGSGPSSSSPFPPFHLPSTTRLLYLSRSTILTMLSSPSIYPQLPERVYDSLTLGIKTSFRQINAPLALATLLLLPRYLTLMADSDDLQVRNQEISCIWIDGHSRFLHRYES